MTCPGCGAANPATRKFCGECGTRLASSCTSCGAPLDAAQKFCGECGAPSGPATSSTGVTQGVSLVAAPVAPPVAERRLVSVLFADLVGFTPFAEERDSEEVRETLSRYFDLARDAIDRHGGTVEKFIGDAVMAVWGTPVAHEDDAERAVRAALELLDTVRSLGSGISARAGVLTGEAAVTLGAAGQGMVAGDLVNTAARLQSAAAPGTVLVGEATYRAASAAIAFIEAGPQSLKGKATPVSAWQALRVVAERGGRGRADQIEAPFVGRDDELRQLKELFHQTGRERRARLVSVTGPAGIGKSRLAWEFEKYLDGVVEPIWWHHGRAPSYGGGITFWALGEMVRSRCGLAEMADEATTREKVAETLARHIPDATERAWVEPAILALLGVEAGQVSTTELFARWRLLFERLATTGTVVMVFEDLQWADGGTVDFIGHLLDWSKALPILVVTLARPELLEARPDWGGGRRNFLAIALDPLPESAMRELLAGLVPDLPEATARHISARAEGIPLYAVETIRMLVSEKRLALKDGRYTVVGDVHTLAVPETLTALIAARLDALAPEDRSLLLDAAVLGQQFTVEGLAAVAGAEAAQLEPRLLSLVRRELLTLEVDPRSPERGQYGFVQGLIREVAYNTLARRDRKERHLAAARFFESLGSDELAGALAGHYLAAHQNAATGPEADALAAQARVALRAAAERAVALGSYTQAVTLLRQALTVTNGPLDRADVLERLGLAALSAGAYAESRAALDEAYALIREHGTRPSAARLAREIGECLLYGVVLVEGRDFLLESIAEYADLGTIPEMIALRGQLARGLYIMGDHRAAIAVADEVLDTAEQEEMTAILADTLVTKGTALANLGRIQEGVALIGAGLRIAEANDLLTTRLRALNNLAVSTTEIDPAGSLRATVDGLLLSRRLGAEGWLRGFTGNLGFMAFRTGDWDLGERELLAVVDEPWEAADAGLIVNNLTFVLAARGRPVDELLARFYGWRGELEELVFEGFYYDTLAITQLAAGDFAAAADSWVRSARGPRMEVPSGLMAARMRLWAGQVDEAARELERLSAAGVHGRVTRLHADALATALAAARGHAPDAAPRLLAISRRMAEIGVPWDAALVALDAGFAVGTANPAAATALREARVFLARVDALPLLEITDRLLALAPVGVSATPAGADGLG